MSKETKHTPGPWKAFEQSSMVFGQDKVVVADTSPADNAYRPEQESWANAQLIASAPELLDALESLVIQLGAQPTGSTLADYCFNARQAIAKARGERSAKSGEDEPPHDDSVVHGENCGCKSFDDCPAR